MTIEAGIVTRLGPLVEGRVAPAPGPRDMAYPFLTYQRTGTTMIGDVLDPGIVPHETIPMQIDCWSNASYTGAVDLAESVRSTLFNARGDYDGDDVIIVRFVDMLDLSEMTASGMAWRRSLSFNFWVRR